MKWLVIFCLLAVHQINAMPKKEEEEEEAGDKLVERSPKLNAEELQEEGERKLFRKREAELYADEVEKKQHKLNSRKRRNAGGQGGGGGGVGGLKGDDSSEDDLDLDVDVKINAPQPHFKADIDIDVNINAEGDETKNPEKQYSLCSMCGTRYKDRIVGGQEAASGMWPWMAHINIIMTSDSYSCGGSIITRDTILTAAHCISGAFAKYIESIEVTVGSVEVPSSGNLTYKVAHQTPHANYNKVTFENDIALLKLEEQLTFSRNVRPVCLADTNMIYEGRKIQATGWGLLDYYDYETPTHLQEVTLDIINTTTCQQLYPLNIVDERHFCTLTPNKDACSGDSGGPLAAEEGDRWYELGIVSYGMGCALPDGPNVATSVPYFKSWILENIGDIICD